MNYCDLPPTTQNRMYQHFKWAIERAEEAYKDAVETQKLTPSEAGSHGIMSFFADMKKNPETQDIVCFKLLGIYKNQASNNEKMLEVMKGFYCKADPGFIPKPKTGSIIEDDIAVEEDPVLARVREILGDSSKASFSFRISTDDVKKLVDALAADLNILKYNNMSLFEHIIMKGEAKGVQYALEKVEYKSDKYRTPFNNPFFNGPSFKERNLEVLDVLLSYTVPGRKNFFDINQEDSQGKTPLDKASSKCDFEYFADKLRDNGALESLEKKEQGSASSTSAEASALDLSAVSLLRFSGPGVDSTQGMELD